MDQIAVLGERALTGLVLELNQRSSNLMIEHAACVDLARKIEKFLERFCGDMPEIEHRHAALRDAMSTIYQADE